MTHKFTSKQGQYLAFIHYYSMLNRRAPSEADIQCHFQVSPPSVHQMVVKLHNLGLIDRIPGQARTLKVLVPAEELPTLEGPKRQKTTCLSPEQAFVTMEVAAQMEELRKEMFRHCDEIYRKVNRSKPGGH